MALSLFGILIVVLTWMQAVSHLYKLPEMTLASFTTITVNSQYVIGAIVIFMVTGRLVYEWRSNTVSSISEIGQQIKEDITEKRTPPAKYFDDETIV
jgi:hypothetical protein